MRHLTCATLLLAMAAPTAARASQGEAQKCAAGLPAPAKLIYESVQNAPVHGMALRDRVRTQTIALVKAGRIDRMHARPAAQEAGVCLKMAQN